MKKLFLLLGVISSVIAFGQSSQTNHRTCSQSEHDAEARAQDPTLSLKHQITHDLYRKYVAKQKANPGVKTGEYVYKIPVVIHIMHDYGSVYTDFINNRSRYFNAMDEINAHFRNEDSLSIQAPFDLISGNTNIEFVLASKDPAGNLTQGITLNHTPLTVDASNTVKSVVQWDNTRYLNIWIVRSIASGAGGWSHLPGISNNLDGIVMLNNQLTDLAHECGHWLGLEHPWGPSNDADLSTNCSLDDGIDDTPNTRGNSYNCTSGLSTTRNSCSDSPVPFRDYLDTYDVWPAGNGEIHDNINNIMDYAFCSAENFTNGQKAYVRSTLSSSPYNGRTNIWTESNLISTGNCDTCGPYNYPPTAEFQWSDDLVCANANVTFTDISYDGTPDTWAWDFGDGTGTSTDQDPVYAYPNPGTYTVKLTASNSGGSDENSKTSIITVGAVAGGEEAPFYENFENGNFPTVSDPVKEWVVADGHQNASWTLSDKASASGLLSYSLKLSGVGSNYVYSMTSPTIDFTNADCFEMSYKYAYAPRFSGSVDQIGIYVSKNCGENWTFVHAASASGINTSGSDNNTSDFIPTSEQWNEEVIGLSQYAGQDNILVKIEFTTGGGNYFYIDDINVGCSDKVGIAEEQNVFMDVYPNPFSDDANINLNVMKGSDMEISVYNVVGAQLYSNTAFYANGRHTVKLSELIDVSNSGVYFVKIKTQSGTITKKVIRF